MTMTWPNMPQQNSLSLHWEILEKAEMTTNKETEEKKLQDLETTHCSYATHRLNRHGQYYVYEGTLKPIFQTFKWSAQHSCSLRDWITTIGQILSAFKVQNLGSKYFHLWSANSVTMPFFWSFLYLDQQKKFPFKDVEYNFNSSACNSCLISKILLLSRCLLKNVQFAVC